MLYSKKAAAFLLALLLAFTVLSPAALAIAPGETDDETLRYLRETRAGHTFNDLMVSVTPGSVMLENLFAGDDRVTDRRELMELRDHTVYVVKLSTNTEEALDAFIADHKNDPGILRFEYNGLAYIDEYRDAVRVKLNLFDKDGKPLGRDVVPADFDDARVKNVVVEAWANVDPAPGLTPEELAAFQSDLPAAVLLELKDTSPESAAALALDLIGFETSDAFTDEQKDWFRTWVADVGTVIYEGFEENALQKYVSNGAIKLWVYNDQAADFEARMAADETDYARQYEPDLSVCASDKSLHTSIYYLYLDEDHIDEAEALREKLAADPAVAHTQVLRGYEYRQTQFDDYMDGIYLQECVTRPGDPDGDYDVTAADARFALRAAVSLERLSESTLLAADTDGDFAVTAADARTLLRTAVGLQKKEDLVFTLPVGRLLVLGPFYDNDGGWLWDVEFTPAADALNVTEREVHLAPPLQLGASSAMLRLVNAKDAGQEYTVTCTYHRPWEPTVDIQYSFKIKTAELP